MEPDFHRTVGDSLTVSTWRIHLESVTREAEERMLSEELPRCLRHIEPTKPDVAVFGCTSAGALGGLAHDVEVGRRIGEGTGAEVVTVVGSMVAELSRVGAHTVAVFTPYTPELTASVTGCVEEAGYDVVKSEGMGILDNPAIGAVEPDSILAFVREGMSGVAADAVFLSCTNWRASEVVRALGEEFGIPVLSSNQVTLSCIRRLAT
jgi:maleate isomerase